LRRDFVQGSATPFFRAVAQVYEQLNPMVFQAAGQMEAELAEDLRTVGYTVYGGY
jgi:hypothetical protein